MADNWPVHTPSRSSLLPAASSDSSPLQGGGREGGPAPGCAGVPPASREARARMRAFGPPCRRDAGASRQFTDERDREVPVRAAQPPGVNPPPDLPPEGGRRENGSRARPCPRQRCRRAAAKFPSAIALRPSLFRGGGVKVAVSFPCCGKMYERAGCPPCRARPPGPGSSPLPGGRSGGGSRLDKPGAPRVRGAAASAGDGREYPPRAIALGNFGAARRRRHRRAGARAAAVFSPPPFRGEVGRGVPPLGAPASRRPRAKRDRGCGPSARHAGGTPALPGNSRMSGIGKVPVRAAEPGQPPSRPPPFQGGGEKTARPASPFGHRERSRTGPPTPPPFQGREVKADSQVRPPWNVPAQGLRGGP